MAGLLGTIGLAVLTLALVYRRFRRNFGRQKIKPRRMMIRLVLLALLVVGFLAASWTFVVTLVVALVCGGVLALYGLRLAKFETNDEGSFYTPNSYVGLAVFSLFVGRLAYRAMAGVTLVSTSALQVGRNFDPRILQQLYSSQMTVAILFVLIGYYLCFYTGVLVRLADRI